MSTHMYRALEDAMHHVHFETQKRNDMCKVCRWSNHSDRKLHCTVDNVAKCPVVAAQINQVHMFLLGIKPMTKDDWLFIDDPS